MHQIQKKKWIIDLGNIIEYHKHQAQGIEMNNFTIFYTDATLQLL